MSDFDLLSTEYRVIVAASIAIAIVAAILFVGFAVSYLRRVKLLKLKKDTITDETFALDVAYFYEKGKRSNQQDSYYISPITDYPDNGLVALVADGMGGLKYGDEISNLIVSKIDEMMPLKFDESFNNSEILRKLSREIYEEYRLQGGSTLAMVHIKGNYMHFYSVGDSDVILIRDGKSNVLNPKQKYSSSLVKKYSKSGQTTYEAYVDRESRALTDFMGNSYTRVIYTQRPIRVLDNDTILVSSDGVTDIVNWKSLNMCVSKRAKSTAEHIKHLIKVKKHPRQDNYTGVIIRLSRNSY